MSICISNFVRHSAHNTFIIQTAGRYLEDCVLAIAEMVRAGSFRPKLSEVSFGPTDSILGKYELTLPDGRILSLDGKIDRLDFMENKGDPRLRGDKLAPAEAGAAVIFDYKRKAQTFNWAEFYYGLDMQLPIYMTAICKAVHSKVKNPVGAFYMPVEVTPAKATFDELSEKTESFGYKAKGILNGEFFQQFDHSDSNKFYNFFVTKKGDQYGYKNKSGALTPADFQQVLQFTERRIVELGEQILSGKIDVKPYRLAGKSPCSFCKYKAVCRFDWQINDYNFLESLNKLRCLEIMGKADA